MFRTRNQSGKYKYREPIGDVVELVELLGLTVLSTPREEGNNGGKVQDTVGATAWYNDLGAF